MKKIIENPVTFEKLLKILNKLEGFTVQSPVLIYSNYNPDPESGWSEVQICWTSKNVGILFPSAFWFKKSGGEIEKAIFYISTRKYVP